jgi:predicted TIM-barrel fold metal-dependent hydrolase
MTVIDTQTHWFSPTLMEAYTEASFYPRCQRDGENFMFELAPDRWFPVGPRFTDIEGQLELFEGAGIDTIISSSASFGDVDAIEPGRAAELAHELNEERAELQRSHPGRFYGLASVPWQDGERALEVVERAAELKLPGVLLHSNIDGAPVDGDHLRPVYARIAELGLVVSIHPARTVAEPELRDYGLEYLVGFMFDTSTAALRLVLSGIVAETPNLKVVHPHCGATLPYLSGRIDASYSQPYSLKETWPEPPSALLGDFYTDTVCQDPRTLAFAEGFYEPGHVVFGSDHPFMDMDRELDFVRNQASDPQAVLETNARALFDLGGA